MPSYSKHLTFFGNIGVAKINKNVKMQSKLKDRGITCMMLGYDIDSSGDTYRLYNLTTRSVFRDRNVTWLNKPFGEYMNSKKRDNYFGEDEDSVSAHSDSDTADLNHHEGAKKMRRTSSSTNVNSSESEPVSSRTRSRLSNVRPTTFAGLNDINEVTHALMALVGGTDTSKDAPLNFKEAWDHPDSSERFLWRDAIRK